MPFPSIGAPELIVILIIALIVLGPGKLPDVAASLGKSIREFRRAASDVSDAAKVESPAKAPVATPAAPATAVAGAVAASPEPTAVATPAAPAADPDRP